MNAEQQEAVRRDDRRGWTVRLLVGVFLVVAGVTWILDELTDIEVPWRALVPALLIAVGVVLVLGSATGRHPGLIALGVVLAVLAAIGTVLPASPLGGVGQRSFAPAHLDAVKETYDLGMGSLEVDLTSVDFPAGQTEIRFNVGMGELIIILPDDVAVAVEGEAGAGEVRLVDTTSSGVAVDDEFVDDGFAAAPSRLVVEARVGLGQIEVRR